MSWKRLNILSAGPMPTKILDQVMDGNIDPKSDVRMAKARNRDRDGRRSAE
jgi:hypothetical protein